MRKMQTKDEAMLTVEEWVENGGALWLEYNTIMTSDDQGEMEDMYRLREDKYAEMELEDYLRVLAENALKWLDLDPESYMW